MKILLLGLITISCITSCDRPTDKIEESITENKQIIPELRNYPDNQVIWHYNNEVETNEILRADTNVLVLHLKNYKYLKDRNRIKGLDSIYLELQHNDSLINKFYSTDLNSVNRIKIKFPDSLDQFKYTTFFFIGDTTYSLKGELLVK